MIIAIAIGTKDNRKVKQYIHDTDFASTAVTWDIVWAFAVELFDLADTTLHYPLKTQHYDRRYTEPQA
jgi:hypothetical protein